MSEVATVATIDYLIVDSRDDRRKTIESILRSDHTANVVGVSCGRDARDLLIEKRVDFVIANLFMPRMTGVELIRFIRRLPVYLDLPILILVDEGTEEEKIRLALEEGADEVIVGPVDEAVFLSAVAKIRQRLQERSPVELSLLEARRLFLQRHYDEAIQKVMGVDGLSTNQEALHLLCECYYRQKSHDKAVQYLKKIITAPTSRTFHLLSKVCLAEDQCGDAITHLTKARIRYPSSLDLRIDLGKLYLGLGMDEQAKEQFDAVLKDEPSDLNFIKMGKAYLARGRLREAGFFLQRAEQPISETVHVFANFAAELEKSGDLSGAAQQYEKCLRMTPNNPNFMLNLCKLYLKIGKREQADLLIHQLHNRFPENEKINNILAYLQTH